MISWCRLHESVGRIATTFLNYSTASKDAIRLSKMLQKMTAREKRGNSFESLLEKSALSSAYSNEGCSKRVATLNKIYMEHITLMINDGPYGRQLACLGIEISKVKLAEGLNFLNLYWVSKNPDIPKNVLNEVLKKTLAELQQQMGTLRFTSKVPFLKFVRDLRLERELYLDRIFETADFGENFQPTHEKKVKTPDFVPQPGEFPEMRQNILGLEHAEIKERIKADILKYKAINIGKRFENECTEVEHESPQKLIQFNKKEFFKFYKRKRILELKLRKMNYNKRENEYYYPETYADEYPVADDFTEIDENADLDEYADTDDFTEINECEDEAGNDKNKY